MSEVRRFGGAGSPLRTMFCINEWTSPRVTCPALYDMVIQVRCEVCVYHDVRVRMLK
jgi:hypothetical protein